MLLAQPQVAVVTTEYRVIMARQLLNTSPEIRLVTTALLMFLTPPIYPLGHVHPQHCINQGYAILSMMKAFSKASEGVLQRIRSIVSLQTWVLSVPCKWGIITIA